ncbi:IS6 family transposase (plasmid) [Halorussus limi]|uniref:IS6 family transposase n=1 Tax=Halorussus limi TaxID=2938695 RepID=A0A8U0I0L7_9EURY|nr:IS6 family transposase [Halorussus limi]UPV76718.1 IS6 family transposase [Halorussus limi]
MLLSDLLRETLDTANLECWQRERTETPVRTFAVRLHAAGCSLRETAAILGPLGVERSHGAVWSWVYNLSDIVPDPPSATPTRVAVDETAVRINGEWSWVYAAIELETKVLLDVAVFGRRGTDPAAAFLHGLIQKHECSETVFLVDDAVYLTAPFRLGLSGQLECVDRNHIEQWFHTLKMRIDRFHSSWVGSRRSVRQCLALFDHYYNFQRPHQALDERMPVEEVN